MPFLAYDKVYSLSLNLLLGFYNLNIFIIAQSYPFIYRKKVAIRGVSDVFYLVDWLFREEAEDGFGSFAGFFVIMEVPGAGDEFEFGADLFGKFFGVLFVDNAVGFAGEEKRIFFERKVSDGILGGELRGAENFAGTRNLVAATLVRDGESFFEEFRVVRDEEKTGRDVIGDEAGRAGGDWNERSNETASAGGDWREENELIVDEVWLGVGDGGSNDRPHGMSNENWTFDMMFSDEIIDETDVGFWCIRVNRGAAKGRDGWGVDIVAGNTKNIGYFGEA